jgi:hypothetical protein
MEERNRPEPPRADRYRPLGLMFWGYSPIRGVHPSGVAIHHFFSASRRLDAAHRQFERVRELLDRYPYEPLDTMQSTTAVVRFSTVLGELELGLIALNRALDMAAQVGRYGSRVPIPEPIKRYRPIVRQLRNTYEHFEERPAGISGMPYMIGFFGVLDDNTLFFGDWALNIRHEVTDLLIATRDFLVIAWKDMLQRAEAERP